MIMTLPAAGNLYMLWTKLWEDNFQTDVISVLCEMNAINVSQEKIYDAQKDVFINQNRAIGILSSVPLFLIEYYDEMFWEKI